MKEITDTLRQRIIEDYIKETIPPNTISSIARKYKITTTIVSSILHDSIRNAEIDRMTAVKIAEKAIYNTKMGGHSTTRVKKFYEDLLTIYDNTIELSLCEFILMSQKRDKYLALLNSFDDVFSDSDEVNFSKEDLIKEIERLSTLIAKHQKIYKKINSG